MSTIQTKIQINSGAKKQSDEPELDIDIQQYSDKLLEASLEAKHISHDPDIHGYNNMEELKKAIED